MSNYHGVMPDTREGGSGMVRKPKLLDLFCGAGGCTKGYQQAGFYVVGVDIKPQPHYCGDEFIQANAMTFPLDGFDVIHASPPCQAYSMARHQWNCQEKEYPQLLAEIRGRLQTSGKPWIIENVTGAPMGYFVELCGTHFNLHVYRHRRFESSMLLFSPGQCHHPQPLLPGFVTVFGECVRWSNARGKKVKGGKADAEKAMGIDWMTIKELCQAIPPAYTAWIGSQLIEYIKVESEVVA